MNLLEMILNAQDGDAVRQLGQNFGLEQGQAASAVSSLVSALSSGLMRNASTEDGLQSLLGALSSGRHQKYLDDLSALGRPETVEDGNGILGHILGSKDVSRQVARSASQRTGVGEDILKKMLPVVAGMVMGALSKQGPSLGAAPREQAAAGGGILDSLASLLDTNRDGSVADDVLGILGRLFQK